jgi:hypothetical protein
LTRINANRWSSPNLPKQCSLLIPETDE